MNDQRDPTRYAIVYGNGVTEREVAAYLPGNYRLVGRARDGVLISGEDSCGWTLDEYVLPRLASGLMFGEEFAGDCDACHGEGTLAAAHPSGDPQRERDLECEACEGTGRKAMPVA